MLKFEEKHSIPSFKSYFFEGIIYVDNSIVTAIMKDFFIVFNEEHSEFVDYIKTKSLEKYEYFVKMIDDMRSDKTRKSIIQVENDKRYIYYTDEKYKIQMEKIELVYIDYDTSIGASFGTNPNTIYVNLISKNFVDMLNLWVNSYNDNNIKFSIDVITDNVEHELIHFVEKQLKTGNKRLKRKSNYDTDMVGYYTSSIEKETQIINVIRRYEKLIKMSASNGQKLTDKEAKEFIAHIVNDTPISINTYLTNSKRMIFIEILKQTKYKTFKEAVKKFYIEAIKSIQKLKEEGYIN